MSKLKLPKKVAEHFFGKDAVEAGLIASLPQVQTKPFHPNLKMKIKYHDATAKKDFTATILDILEDDKLRVSVEHSGGVCEAIIIDAKQVSGLYITTLGRELELSFGVGKVSSSSLIDERY